MSKFKVGDKVVRTVGSRKDEDFLRMLGEAAYYTVTSVSSEGYWLQVNGVSKAYDERPWAAINFELYQEPEEELPPVPDSVYYPDMYTLLTGKRSAGGTSGLTMRQSPDTEGAISISIGHSKWTRLDADAALQLAHDLLRMAMDIKRKEKANV